MRSQPLRVLTRFLLFHLLFLELLLKLFRLLLEAYEIGVRPLACELYAVILRTLGRQKLPVFKIGIGQAVIGLGRVWIGLNIAPFDVQVVWTSVAGPIADSTVLAPRG